MIEESDIICFLRSRNVFLRVTDGRKYCYYSCYSWGATFAMGSIALFAHFMLDTNNSKSSTLSAQKTIGQFTLFLIMCVISVRKSFIFPIYM